MKVDRPSNLVVHEWQCCFYRYQNQFVGTYTFHMTFKWNMNMWHVACEKLIIQHVLVLLLHLFLAVLPSLFREIGSRGNRRWKVLLSCSFNILLVSRQQSQSVHN